MNRKVVHIILIVVLLGVFAAMMTGCATQKTKYSRDDIETARIIQSKASAVLSIVTGKVDSCALLVTQVGLLSAARIIYKDGSCEVTLNDQTDPQ